MAKNRYQRIVDREDKKRPYKVSEIMDLLSKSQDSFVMKMKVLTPEGSTFEYSWSERDQDTSCKHEVLKSVPEMPGNPNSPQIAVCAKCGERPK